MANFSKFLKRKELSLFLSPLINILFYMKGEPLRFDKKSLISTYFEDKLKSSYGIKLDKDTRLLAIKEQLVDRIYTSFDSFMPSKGNVVVDVGAETGDYTIFCAIAYHCSHVYAFEPLIGNFRVLSNNIELNNCSDRVTAYNLGLSSAVGYANASYDGDTINWISSGKEMSIKLKTLDSFDLANVDILKIDAEGNELEILKGSVNTIKSSMPKIIIETHSKMLREQVTNFLHSLNYKLIFRGKCTKSSDGLEVWNLFFGPVG